MTREFITLPLPPFFNPAHAKDFNYRPWPAQLMQEAEILRKQYGVRRPDPKRIIRCICIDRTKCFCFPPDPARPIDLLWVAGTSPTDNAMANSARMAEFGYVNLFNIDEYIATMDGHPTWHITMSHCYEFADGSVVPAFTQLNEEKLLSGEIRPRAFLVETFGFNDYAELLAHVLHLVREFRRLYGIDITLWSPHGFPGDAQCDLVGVTAELIQFHEFVRGVNNLRPYKGTDPRIEFNSPFLPVPRTWAGGGLVPEGAFPREKVIWLLKTSWMNLFEGEALNFCLGMGLMDTIEIAHEIGEPKLLDKCFVFEDGSSSVTMPDGNGGVTEVGLTRQYILDTCRNAGMHVVTSDVPMAAYPNMMKYAA